MQLPQWLRDKQTEALECLERENARLHLSRTDYELARWRIRRRGGIGGSDLGTLLGMNPWKSPLELWQDKTWQTELEILDNPDPKNDRPKRMGQYFEQVVADEYTIATGNQVRRKNQMVWHDNGLFFANVDRLVQGTRILLECKKQGYAQRDRWGDTDTTNIPREILCQVMHYMGILDRAEAHVAVLLGDYDFRWYCIPRNDEVIDKMWAAALAWWETYVLENTAPPPRSVADVLKLFPESIEERSVVATDAVMGMCEGLASVKHELKELGDAKESYEFEIKKFMEAAEGLMDPTGELLATWRTGKRGRSFRLKLQHRG